MDKLKHSDLTREIINVYFEVYNTLGYGFLEKVYENALLYEFSSRGMNAVPQQRITVYYKGNKVGVYYADIIVENTVILEVKAAETLIPPHEAQLINYLKSSHIELGLLFNFGKSPQFTRKVFSEVYKPQNSTS